MKKTLVALAATSVMMTGCAVVPPNSGSNPADPWETMNRQTQAFNQGVDRLILHPLAVNYVEYVPEGVRDSVGNFFTNIGEIDNTLNNLLQGKFVNSAVSLMRFVVNSTVGVVGLFDVATYMGLEHAPEDFGQTLGVWGVPQGPYFVIPVMGMTTVRDGVGMAVSVADSPLTYLDQDKTAQRALVYTSSAIYPLHMRAKLLATDAMMATAVDPYVAMRDAYLQHRQNLVYDGNPPIVLPEDDFDDFEEDLQ